MKSIDVPIVLGPGSQPADNDGAEMDFMNMPSGMSTFSAPMVPQPEDAVGQEKAVELASEIQRALDNFKVGDQARVFDITRFDGSNRDFIDQLLGEGEVSVQCSGNLQALIQESVLAGVWRVQYTDEKDNILRDTIEVAIVPSLVADLTFADASTTLDPSSFHIPADVYNAPPLLTEIADRLNVQAKNPEHHIINLSLLPHTEEDLMFLSDALGIGPVIILSRGYGNCRISSTKTRNVWWVQYFNSQETLILNTLEISQVPEVACASQEDIEDSAERLQEILSIY